MSSIKTLIKNQKMSSDEVVALVKLIIARLRNLHACFNSNNDIHISIYWYYRKFGIALFFTQLVLRVSMHRFLISENNFRCEWFWLLVFVAMIAMMNETNKSSGQYCELKKIRFNSIILESFMQFYIRSCISNHNFRITMIHFFWDNLFLVCLCKF